MSVIKDEIVPGITPMHLLRARLARGEISVEEFNTIKETLGPEGNIPFIPLEKSNTAQNTPSQEARKQEKSEPEHIQINLSIPAITPKNLFSNLFGSYEIPDITDSTPFHVTKKLSLYESYFTYNNQKHSYNEIVSVDFAGYKREVNLINVGSVSGLTLVLASGEKISELGYSAIITGKKNKLLYCASRFVSGRTFDNRFRTYSNKLRSNGFLEVKHVKITFDGNIDDGRQRISLKEAAKNKGLLIGTHFGLGYDQNINPNEVMVSDKGIWTKLMFSGIKFEVTADKDVLFEIIKQLAEV